MGIAELQEQVVLELCNIVTEPWDSIELHYENSIVDGYARSVYKSFYFVDGNKYQFGLTAECHDYLFELSDNRREDNVENWTWFDLKINNTGRYAFDFGYGTPPLLEREMELQARFPDDDLDLE